MTVQIRVWVLASLIFFGFSSLGWGEPTGAWSPLMAKAKSQKVRVIVQFRDSDSLNKNLSTRPAQTQRAKKIEGMQNEFLSSLSTQGHQPRKVKKFRYMPFMAMEADSAMLDALRANPNVVGIEEDVMYRASLVDSNPLVGGDIFFNSGYTGAGQTVAILDTGVEKTHSFFGGRVVSEACYSTNDPFFSATSVCPGGVEASTAPDSGLNCDALDPSIADACNHGTHVAGIADGNGVGFNGMALDANVIAIQVFSKISSALPIVPRSLHLVWWRFNRISFRVESA
jgi:subtilisin family serine protease